MKLILQITEHSLENSNALIGALKNAQTSFLDSESERARSYEEEHYNDIFNVLPNNPADIRYVEEYTSDEWTEEAYQLAHSKIVRIQMRYLVMKNIGKSNQ